MTDTSLFRRKLEERRKREAEERAKVSEPEPTFDEELIPESDLPEADQELDRFINSLDILDAYRRWCGKSTIDAKVRRTEGIKISCPKPDHPDRDPSAWINTDKQVWFCGGCQEGGDVYDIAAFHFGYPVPDYKTGENFHKLRRDMAESYGYTFVSPPGIKGDIAIPPEDERITTPLANSNEAEEAGQSGLGQSPAKADESDTSSSADVFDLDWAEEDRNVLFPSLDWRKIIPENTFLDEYMKATTADDITEEYHFWNALIALGFAVGRDVTLIDIDPIYANLFVCSLGHSGSGKSRANRHLRNLLNIALPYNGDDPNSKGAKMVPVVGSAEALITAFCKPVPDPVNPKAIAYYAPVRGFVEVNELSHLVGKASRTGSVIKPVLMQFYDGDKLVTTSSMTHGTKAAHDPFASALTTTQPRAIRALLNQGDADSGFLNRWVFAAGRPKKRVAIGGAAIDVSTAADSLLKVHGWAGSFSPGEQVTWSEEAAERFTEFFDNYIEPNKNRDDSDILTRTDLLMKKLTLLFTINLRKKVVPIEAVESAFSMYQYVLDCYALMSSELGNTLQHQVRAEILRLAKTWLDKHKTGITQRELGQRLNKKKFPLDLQAKTIKYMCDLGELDPVVAKGPGRPTTRYKYVD